MTTEHTSSAVRASRPQQVDYNRRVENSETSVASPRAAGETPEKCLRHRAVIRARRRRRGFGGAVLTDFTRQEIALNTI